jgi:hypothetical protein
VGKGQLDTEPVRAAQCITIRLETHPVSGAKLGPDAAAIHRSAVGRGVSVEYHHTLDGRIELGRQLLDLAVSIHVRLSAQVDKLVFRSISGKALRDERGKNDRNNADKCISHGLFLNQLVAYG